jgi:predicted AlkP superfamily phosphohydrolase/phosphomutase
MEKLLIFGIDGADPEFTRRMMKKGELPNLQKLADNGFFSHLLSTNPPLTPQAWTSFVSGVNPGKHGVFDFGEFPFDSYESRLNNSDNRATKAFWNYLSDEGLRVGVVNLPLSWPAENPPGGYIISGMHTPDLSSICANEQVADFVRNWEPGYMIDTMSYWHTNPDGFVAEVREMVRRRAEFGLELRRRFPVDVFCIVFVGLDRVSHAFYGQQEHVVGDQGWKYQQLMAEIYRQIDEVLGRFLQETDSETDVMVLSDHGFGTLKKDVYLNNFLQECGYLDFSAAELSRSLITHRGWNRDAGFGGLVNYLSELSFFRRNFLWKQRSFTTVDWAQTEAFSTGLFGNIFIHRKGRFPLGFIEKGSEQYHDIIAELVQDLMFLRDEGVPVVDEISMAEEVYHGPFVDKAPDLILKMKDYSYITRGGTEFFSDRIFDEPLIRHSGNHRLNGILLMSGKSVRSFKGRFVSTPNLMDLLPTMLYMLGLPMPEDLDGRVLREAMTGEYEPVYYQGSIYRTDRQTENSTGLDDKVWERLKALGYMP